MRILLIVAALLLPLTAKAEPITGRAIALDGDTLIMGRPGGENVRIRLWAIYAPEMNNWPWGPLARMQLDALLVMAELSCDRKGKSHNRIVAQCFWFRNGERLDFDIGKALILSGYALEYRSFGQGVYAEAERKAQKQKSGVWAENKGVPFGFISEDALPKH